MHMQTFASMKNKCIMNKVQDYDIAVDRDHNNYCHLKNPPIWEIITKFSTREKKTFEKLQTFLHQVVSICVLRKHLKLLLSVN